MSYQYEKMHFLNVVLGASENRSIEQSLDQAWSLLRIFRKFSLPSSAVLAYSVTQLENNSTESTQR